MGENNLVSFVIPCYRSEKTIQRVVDEICEVVKEYEYSYEIILINDFSPDNLMNVLRELAENPCIKVISFSKNFGQHAGMLAGLRVAKGENVVILDDDGQCPVKHVNDLLKPLSEGYDAVFAEYGKKKQSAFKNLCSNIHGFVTNILTEKPNEIEMTNFIALSRTVVDEIIRYEGPYPIISGLIFRSVRRIANVPMPERERMEGGTNYNLRRLFELWLNTFSAFSIKPLRFAAFLGIMSSLGGLVFALVIIFRKIANASVTIGWTSTIALNLILGGLILFVLGLMGEYIGRIYMTINSTPQYVIKECINIEEI